MKLWQCSICERVAFWGPTWNYNSSILIDDECASRRLIVCSDACHIKADKMMQSGELALPTVKMRGPITRMTKPQIGYEPQPEQRDLIEVWNAKHPDEQIHPAFSRP